LSFSRRLISRWGSSTQEIEELETETAVHPFFDAFWEVKRAQMEMIQERKDGKEYFLKFEMDSIKVEFRSQEGISSLPNTIQIALPRC
jgi:hypothetical protein